jgi:uncharacterized glyoxalase superfamily protein PhnB
MSQKAQSTIIAGLRYYDAVAAMTWLCHVFGLERQLVHANPDGSIAHAQLVSGGGMVMLGSVSNASPYGRLCAHPGQTGGKVSMGLYLLVPDADAVLARAREAGAKILIDIKDEPYGGRGFTCADPEGYVWTVGTYDPWPAA